MRPRPQKRPYSEMGSRLPGWRSSGITSQRSSGSTSGNWSRLAVCATILSLSLAGSIASATTDSVHLEKGNPAPFTGYLVPTDRILRLGQKAERCEFLLEQNLETQKKRCEIDLNFVRKTHEIDNEKWLLRERAMERRLERTFWTQPIFVAVVTAVATYALLTTAKRLP